MPRTKGSKKCAKIDFDAQLAKLWKDKALLKEGVTKTVVQMRRGWLNYFGIADMQRNIESLNGWLCRRIRMCIWKQWKLPKTRKRKLLGLGLPEWAACEGAYSRKAYWRMAGIGVVQRALTKERLIHWGFYDLATAYQSMHVNC